MQPINHKAFHRAMRLNETATNNALADAIARQLIDYLESAGLQCVYLTVMNSGDVNIDFTINPVNANTSYIFSYIGIDQWQTALDADPSYTEMKVRQLVEHWQREHEWKPQDEERPNAD